MNLNVDPDVFCLLQCDAADDAQQVLARETQTATLMEKDDTGSDVNNDSVNALEKSEGARNDSEEDRSVGLTSEMQTESQTNTEDQKKTAVVNTNETKISSLGKCESISNVPEENSAVKLLSAAEEDISNAVNYKGAEILSSETQILTLGKSEGVSNAGEDDGAGDLVTDV